MYRQSKKLVKQQYLHHTSLQYGKLHPTNGRDRLASLWHPSKFQRVLHLGFVTAATLLTGGQRNFARCLAVSWAATLYIHFRGCCHLTEFRQVKVHFTSKSCVLLYWHRYCTALQQHSSAKRCGVVQGMELRTFAEGATYIRMGGPHIGHRPTF